MVSLMLLSLVSCVFFSTQVMGKHFNCKTRMAGKKSEHQYCGKFGTAQHDKMLINVKSRVLNAPHLAPTEGIDDVRFEIAAIADQDYEKLTSSSSCYDKRKAATKLINVVVPVDGRWSSEL